MTSRTMITLTMLALVGACAEYQADPACPPGTEPMESGYCHVSEAFLQDVGDKVGSGVVGFAQMYEGNCMPRMEGDTSENTCRTRVVARLPVQIYDPQDLGEEPCVLHYPHESGATPIMSVLTGDDGIFALGLSPGSYCFAAQHPGGISESGLVEVTSDAIARSWLTFDYASY